VETTLLHVSKRREKGNISCDETSEYCFQNIGNHMKPPLITFNLFHLVHMRDTGGTLEKLKITLKLC
jgi:hypothetical protein